MLTSMLLSAAIPMAPPVVVVDRDNVRITESCTIETTEEAIDDADGNGVIHVAADDVTITFADEPDRRELFGAPEGTPWNELTGIGIRIEGHRNVTISNAHLHRFKVGIYATDADGLVLENCDVAGGFAQRLQSTPEAEHGGDWLWPHRNDANEWMHNYGAGIYVEDSADVTINDCHARRRQNGIVIDGVSNSRIYDNDCSFLSGWGLAMWRSSRNVITRNAFDFCVRGYSHRVYNRGQDSAGILMFEQNSENVIAENSATHGGDGFFGFAGRDALGEVWLERERRRLREETGREGVDELIIYPKHVIDAASRAGNNDNLLINNDFSYAPAHGIEMTFSFGNRFIGNRLVENAICGVWGGFSQDTLIAGNHFEGNGGGAYGLERGGINIEHSRNNRFLDNDFIDNRCGVHLWWDPDEAFMTLPWAKANQTGLPANDDGSIALTTGLPGDRRMLPCVDNVIADNRFDGDDLVIQLRHADRTITAGNEITGVEGRFVDLERSTLETHTTAPGDLGTWEKPEYPVYGENRPVGARPELRGRDKIIITEWGPYDWQGPHLQRLPEEDGAHLYRLLGEADVQDVDVTRGADVRVDRDHEFPRIRVLPQRRGRILPYTLAVRTDNEQELTSNGVLLSTQWTVRVFEYETDPREDVEQWRHEARSGRTFKTSSLDLPYAGGGPSQLAGVPDELREAGLRADRFGTIATTRLTFPPGKWRIVTNSDDGIRVWVGDEVVVEDWTWHGPTRHVGEVSFDRETTVEVRVEHFELDGYSVLDVDFEPAGQ